MRVPRELIIKDPCQVSVDFLRARCLDYFRSEKDLRARHVWFADHYKDPPSVPENAVLDVVFFGGFVRRFLESGNWTAGRYRFWCLTGSVKQVLVGILGVPAESVGVIPRERLDGPRATRSTTPLPKATAPYTFVFGGRLSATKNLELVIRMVNVLQMELHRNVKLVLSGDFDDRMHPDRGLWRDESYARHIEDVIAGLTWTEAPVFKHRLGPRVWTRQKYTRPVYLNLSTYVYEDFDVSLSQAREAGWPAVISDWGGHRDLAEGPGLLKIPAAMIGHSHEGSALTQARARSLAVWIDGELGKSRKKERRRSLSAVPPRALELSEIDAIRRRFVKKCGSGALTLQRRHFDGYSYEPGAEKFFAAYRACFAAPFEKEEAVAVVVNDLHASKRPGLADVASVCSAILSEKPWRGRPVVFLPAQEILHPMNAAVVHAAREIIIPFASPHVKPLVKHWRGSGVEGEVAFVTHRSAKDRRLEVKPIRI